MVFAIINKAAVNIFVCLSVDIHFHVFLFDFINDPMMVS